MQTTLNIKMDNKIKKEAQKLAKVFGISLNSIVIEYIKKFVYQNQS